MATETAVTDKVKKTHHCPRCAKTVENVKAPRGWHKIPNGTLICDECFPKAYQPICIRLPIAGPHPHTNQPQPWDTLRTSVSLAWDQSMRLANWAITEILKNEPAQLPDQARLPKLSVYLYGAFGESKLRPHWGGAAQSANAVLRLAEQKYRALRGQIQGTHSASAPTFRWPTPFPVPRQAWSAYWVPNGANPRGHAVLSIPLLGEQRFELRVRNDRTTPIHLQRLGMVLDGSAIGGELRVVAKPTSPNDRKNGVQFRRPGGGETKWFRLLVHISAYVPVTERRPPDGKVMTVHTGADSLLYAEVEDDDEPWVVHADHVRQWVIASKRIRQRRSDDLKHEERMPAKKRRRRNEAMARHNGKYERRLTSACEQISAWVVNYAKRRRVSVIHYDETVRDFCPDFSYARLRELIRRKSEAIGLTFLLPHGPAAPAAEQPQPEIAT